MDPSIPLGTTIVGVFTVVIALLVGMQRVKKLVAQDVMDELTKCEAKRELDSKTILELSTQLARALERISNLEQVMVKYLQPIGGIVRREVDKDPLVQEVLKNGKT